MQILEFIFSFTDRTKQLIGEFEKTSDSGENKKEALDAKLVKWTQENFDNLVKINFFFKGSLKKFVIRNIPKLTQAIYNLIRTRIPGVGE